MLKHPRIGRHIHRAEALERVSLQRPETAPEGGSEQRISRHGVG